MWRPSTCCESTKHADAGVPRADRDGRLQALVVVARRHPHVDDGEVRLVLGYDGEQRVRITDARHDFVAGVFEKTGEALAQQHGVLGDHDSHGSATSSSVPRPGGLRMRS